MSFCISWLAVRGKSKSDVLAQLNLVESAEVESGPSEVSGATLPDWYLVFVRDFFHPYTEAVLLRDVSRGAEVLSCRVDERAMMSFAEFYRDGERVWQIEHQSAVDLYHVATQGSPPDVFAEYRDAQIASRRSTPWPV